MKGIEYTKKTCAKVVDQVSHTWEALMGDRKSQRIVSEPTVLEENIT